MVASHRILLIVLACILFAAPACAHPHVWITMKTELVYAPDGSVTAVRHSWAFDEMYSAFAVQGLDKETKGVYTRADLAPLAKVNITSLKDYDYFTFATVDGKMVPFAAPTGDYWLDYKDATLTLHFTLPFKEPVKAKDLLVEIYDPTIYVDLEFAKDKPVTTSGIPAQCKMTFRRPPEMRLVLGKGKPLSETFFNSLTPVQNWGAQFANKIMVTCG